MTYKKAASTKLAAFLVLWQPADLLQAVGVDQVAALMITLGAQRIGDAAGLLGILDDGLNEFLHGHVGIVLNLLHCYLLRQRFNDNFKIAQKTRMRTIIRLHICKMKSMWRHKEDKK